MEEKNLLAEMQKTFSEKKGTLKNLVQTYQVAKLGNEVQKEQIKEAYNRVLAENEFFAETECSRGEVKIKKGDRILDETFMFLLSDNDFEKFLKLTDPILVEQKITDKNGCYITNWSMMEVESVNKIFEFVCKEVLPKEYGDNLWEFRWKYSLQQKVLALTCQLFGLAA